MIFLFSGSLNAGTVMAVLAIHQYAIHVSHRFYASDCSRVRFLNLRTSWCHGLMDDSIPNGRSPLTTEYRQSPDLGNQVLRGIQLPMRRLLFESRKTALGSSWHRREPVLTITEYDDCN